MKTSTDYQLAWDINRSWNGAFDGFFHMSDHARNRMCSRGLSPRVIKAVLTHGEVIYDRGAMHFRVGKRVVNELRRRGIEAAKLAGLHVIVGVDGVIKTVYRNHTFRRPRKTHRPVRGPKYYA